MLENFKQAYMPKTEFPRRTVDREKCKRCKRCFDACPTAGFVLDTEGYPVPVGYGGLEQACLNCWNCVAVCPEGAISMEGAYRVPEGRYKTRLAGAVTPPDPLGLGGGKSWAEFEAELTPVERTIYKRRSNRLFKKKPVSRELLLRVLEAGRFAPSAGNCQPYKFIVITRKDAIADIERLALRALVPFKNLYMDRQGKRRWWKAALFTTLSTVMVNQLDQRPFTAVQKAENDGGVYWDAPAVILICKNPRGISNPDLDTGICAQNMVLAAHSLGLGACYIGLSVEPMRYPHMAALKKRIGVVPPWEPVTSIALGWPRGEIDTVVARDSPPVEWIE
jgi:nitroreductase/NAD-dependent dihydropyrimidine dehydrogenase PreA subunit